MIDLETLVPPVAEPVNLAEARAWLRIGTDGDDAVLTRIIAAGRARFEAETGRALMARTVRERFSPLPKPGAGSGGAIELLPAIGPATSIVSAKMVDATGTETDAPPGFITIAGRKFRVARAVPALIVTYVAGAANADAVSFADRVSVLEIIASLYAARDGRTAIGLKKEPQL